MTIAQLNEAGREEFVDAIGSVFEDSPWVAMRAWEFRPFSDLDDLHAALAGVVDRASEPERIALISAHPDLAGRAASHGGLTASSREEQNAAGLGSLSAQEKALFDSLNRSYRDRFGFPFVICARENTRQSILAAMQTRIHNDRQAEIATALGEIAKIARLRLLALVGQA